MTAPIRNLADAAFAAHVTPDRAFAAKLARLGPELGCEKLGVMLTVLEPGKAAFPLHAHHAVEELFYVVAGDGTYRLGAEEHPIKAGDLIAAPAGGPDAAHQIVNTGDAPLTFLAVSTMDPVDVVEYPEAGKLRVYAQGGGSDPAAARLNRVLRSGPEADLYADDGDPPGGAA